ncbi:MAG: FkbM family methyltransferase [Chitinophagaceae bacterium]|nr:MAG: FkbM family methyltransferase [Chitinophagaceae bacterium]
MFFSRHLYGKFVRGKQVLLAHRKCLQHLNLSFSQEGEDLVLHRHFNYKPSGFYVDVGAHHPYRFSNTFKFYLKGWRGINIDPLPGSMKLFDEKRPKDINLEIGISENDGETLNYYMFDEPTLNTFDPSLVQRAEGENYRLEKTVTVKTVRLSSVLDQHLRQDQPIDFLTIDVEGFDLYVLRSNNWDKYRPAIVIAESYGTRLEDDLMSPVSKFLATKNYQLVSKTANSLFYKDQEQ